MPKISLHRLFEDVLGIGKMNRKEQLEELLADDERLDEVVRIIQESGSKSENTSVDAIKEEEEINPFDDEFLESIKDLPEDERREEIFIRASDPKYN